MPTLKGVEVVHYRRNLHIELTEDMQKALLYIYGMMQSLELLGLPVANDFEDCQNETWQHIVFPETSDLAFQNALHGCGFERCIDPVSERDLDFWERMQRGEEMITNSHHNGFTGRKEKDNGKT